MIEDNVDALIARFSAHALAVKVSPRVEGSPLLEFVTEELVLHVFERTGPYLAVGGPARVIVQPETAALTRFEPDPAAAAGRIDVVSVSALQAEGQVVHRDDPFVVVDAGLPLVVSVDTLDDDVQVGTWVRFRSRAPVHGFVLPPERRQDRLAPDDHL